MAIARIFEKRSSSKGSSETVRYVLGLSETKSDSPSDHCHYLTQNWLLLPVANSQRLTPAEKVELANRVSGALDAHSAQNPKVRFPIWHGIFAIAGYDRALTDAELAKMADEFMKDMGFEACPWIATVHRDTDNPHVHIVASTVRDEPGYPVVKQYKDYDRAMASMRKLERMFNLNAVPEPANAASIDSLRINSQKNTLRTYLDSTINQLKRKPGATYWDFYQELRQFGITVNTQWKKGLLTGISYEIDGFATTGAKLGAKGRYSIKGLADAGLTLGGSESARRFEEATCKTTQHSQQPPNTLDFMIRVSISHEASEVLRKSKRIREPDAVIKKEQHYIFGYKLRLKKLKRSRYSPVELLKQLTESLAKLLRSLAKYLGAKEVTVMPMEPARVIPSEQRVVL